MDFFLFHPVSEFFLCILIVSFVTEMGLLKKIFERLRIVFVSLFTPCFVTSSDQGCRSVPFVLP